MIPRAGLKPAERSGFPGPLAASRAAARSTRGRLRRPWRTPLALVLGLAVFILVGDARAFILDPDGNAAQAPHALAVHATTLPTAVLPGEAFRLFVRARLGDGWHIYSIHLADHDAPMATRVILDESGFPARGDWEESPARLALDGALGRAIKIHRREAEFQREFIAPQDLSPGDYPISGRLWFRACDNKVCTMPQELGFKARLKITAPGPPGGGP